jgi:tetratricopeptide (TPR) repeat protein
MRIGYHPFRIPSVVPILVSMGFVCVALTTTVLGQNAACPAIGASNPTPAEEAYAAGRYSRAEDLYGEELSLHPKDLKVSAAFAQTLVREGEISRATTVVNKMLAENPQSALSLTVLAELRLREGEPWSALETLKDASAADPCYARTHLIRARAFRLDSMYASERAEIQAAYDLNPTDSDIQHAWRTTVSPAHDIEAIEESLQTTKDLDSDTKERAEDSVRSMMTLLSENNQTCHLLPTTPSATFSLLPSYLDAKRVDGYRIEVNFPRGKAHLQLDTAASGLFISRALADENGFQPASGDPPGTVHVETLHIGPLEFRDCVVGVSDAPFAGKADGFIGTDMFASWLITLDHPKAQLVLEPLPKLRGAIPGDRITSPELAGFLPVYHRQQFLLVPVTLDNKSRKLFVLDTGLRFSSMTSETAHSVSNLKMNFTNPVQTISGSTLQVYRDNFDFQFANLSMVHQSHILELDTSRTEQSAGIQIAGMLGFDMLHSLTMHLDYRDGLVKFDSAGTEGASHDNRFMTAAGAVNSGIDHPNDCGPGDDTAMPIASTIEAKVTGLIDSARLRPGKEINVKVLNEWSSSECSLPSGSTLYGHVTAVNSTRSPDSSELSLVFDHGECGGGTKKSVSLRIIGLIASPDQFVGLHSALPSQVAGGGRSISQSAADMGSLSVDENLNPGGNPHTVHPGIAFGFQKIKLEPSGGPGCSTRITSTEREIHLGVGAELILTMQVTH